jgi:DNA-binding NarL/FixJ family response regulator
MHDPTFLVIDDHASVLEGTLLSLKQAYPEATIEMVQTAEQARQKLKALQPSVIVVDLSIPETTGKTAQAETGIQLLRELLETCPAYNFVVQSANIKALIRIKPSIDSHQGGFTIADKSEPMKEMLTQGKRKNQ